MILKSSIHIQTSTHCFLKAENKFCSQSSNIFLYDFGNELKKELSYPNIIYSSLFSSFLVCLYKFLFFGVYIFNPSEMENCVLCVRWRSNFALFNGLSKWFSNTDLGSNSARKMQNKLKSFLFFSYLIKVRIRLRFSNSLKIFNINELEVIKQAGICCTKLRQELHVG